MSRDLGDDRLKGAMSHGCELCARPVRDVVEGDEKREKKPASKELG